MLKTLFSRCIQVFARDGNYVGFAGAKTGHRRVAFGRRLVQPVFPGGLMPLASPTPFAHSLFTVLDDNPLTTKPRLLNDIAVIATVVDGGVFPVLKPATGLAMSSQNQKTLALLKAQFHENGGTHSDSCSINHWLQAAASEASNL